MLLMGWRELEPLERIRFINVQESVKERSGTFILGVEFHCSILSLFMFTAITTPGARIVMLQFMNSSLELIIL